MDFKSSGMKVDKLRDDNFHTWKHRFLLILSLKELYEYLNELNPAPDSIEYLKWCLGDRKAKALISLTLSDAHLEQAQHAVTATAK